MNMRAPRSTAGRFVMLMLLAAAAGGAWGAGEQPAAAKANQAAPSASVGLPGVAVVELFTSAGCSSCTRAEGVLASLLARSRETGIPAYALAWQIGYRNTLGGQDPSTPTVAALRRRRYAAKLSMSLSTPEIVVNGAASSARDLRAVERLAAAARAKPAAAAVLIAVRRGASTSQLAVRVATTGAPAGSSVDVVLVEDGIVHRPGGGENGKHSLRHEAVVRSFAKLPAAGGQVMLTPPPGVHFARSRIVAFVQTASLAIVGANEIDLAGVPTETDGPARASGRLVAHDFAGLEGAQIQACSDTLCLPARTDPSGRFVLSGIPAGHYDVKLFLPARSARPISSLPVEIRAGEDVSLPTLTAGT